jgi:hypothetical protein
MGRTSVIRTAHSLSLPPFCGIYRLCRVLPTIEDFLIRHPEKAPRNLPEALKLKLAFDRHLRAQRFHLVLQGVERVFESQKRSAGSELFWCHTGSPLM